MNKEQIEEIEELKKLILRGICRGKALDRKNRAKIKELESLEIILEGSQKCDCF